MYLIINFNSFQKEMNKQLVFKKKSWFQTVLELTKLLGNVVPLNSCISGKLKLSL